MAANGVLFSTLIMWDIGKEVPHLLRQEMEKELAEVKWVE